jgi:uncharacterized membrane protein YfcA
MRGADRLQAVLGGVGAGLAGGLFGVGGGIVLIPMLTRRFGATQHQAHGTSLAVIGLSAIAGVIVYAWHGHVVWSTAAVVAIAGALTARFGARWATRTSSAGLARAFALLLVLVAVRLLLLQTPPGHVGPLHHGLMGVAIDLGLGGAVGVLAGFMGVGGGILAVPVFILVLGMDPPTAQGTSLAVIMVSGPAGAIEHARHGNVIGRLVPSLAVGAVVGAPLSSWLAQLLPHLVMVRSFAIFLLLTAVVTWFRPPPAARPAEVAMERVG